MNESELSELESLAKAATPGPWRHPGRALVVSRMSEDEPLVCDCTTQKFAQAPKDAAYIASANPAAVLELIAELRQAWAERDWLAKYIIKHGGCPSKDIWEKCTAEQDETNLCTDCWLKAAKEATKCK